MRLGYLVIGLCFAAAGAVLYFADRSGYLRLYELRYHGIDEEDIYSFSDPADLAYRKLENEESGLRWLAGIIDRENILIMNDGTRVRVSDDLMARIHRDQPTAYICEPDRDPPRLALVRVAEDFDTYDYQHDWGWVEPEHDFLLHLPLITIHRHLWWTEEL